MAEEKGKVKDAAHGLLYTTTNEKHEKVKQKRRAMVKMLHARQKSGYTKDEQTKPPEEC